MIAVDLHSVGRVPYARVDGRGGGHTDPVKNMSLSLHDLLSTGRHLLGASFTSSLQPNLRTSQTTQNATENNCIISHAQNTNTLQPKYINSKT